MEVIARPRRSGKTSYILEKLRQDQSCTTVMLVHNQQTKDLLCRQHPELASRIETVRQIMSSPFGYRETSFYIDEIELCMAGLIRDHMNVIGITVSISKEDNGWDN